MVFTRVAGRRYPVDEKIRILTEGIRGESTVSELCRCEAIHPIIHCNWLKDVVEGGTGRFRGDAMREAVSEGFSPLSFSLTAIRRSVTLLTGLVKIASPG